jgi:uncharacterized protein YndB with AHSA1/START domain
MIQTQTDDTAVRMTIEVDVSIERAFEVFTTKFDRIKPREHNLLGEEIAETVLEPRAGGRLYDRGVSGATCHWGRVLDVTPPHRLLLAWDISLQWQVETDHSRSSEVEVRFMAIGDRRTRVELEHRHLDRHGEGWQGMAAAVGGDGGWPLYVNNFVALLTEV